MMTFPIYGKIKFMFQTFQTTNQFFWWTILAISETLLLHEFGTSTNLGRYHRLPHVCTMYGILFRRYYWKMANCKHMGTVYDRSFKRGLAICYGPIACPMCCTITENQCHSLVCFSLPEFLRWFLCVQEFSISDWGSIFHNIYIYVYYTWWYGVPVISWFIIPIIYIDITSINPSYWTYKPS